MFSCNASYVSALGHNLVALTSPRNVDTEHME